MLQICLQCLLLQVEITFVNAVFSSHTVCYSCPNDLIEILGLKMYHNILNTAGNIFTIWFFFGFSILGSGTSHDMRDI